MKLSEFFTKYDGNVVKTSTNYHMHKINDNIWLGSTKARRHIHEYHITAVISIMTEFERQYFIEEIHRDIVEYKIDLDDRPSANLIKAIYQVRNILDDNKDKTFLIHCVMGRSRSASVLIGYLMLTDNLSYDEAYDKILKCRPSINPNDGFKKQLNSCWIPLEDDGYLGLVSSS